MFETSAEVLGGLIKAFRDYGQKNGRTWRAQPVVRCHFALPSFSMQPCRAARPSKHSIGVCGLVGHNLQNVPVLPDLTPFIELEDVDSGPHVITGPILATMKDHIVTFGDYPFEFHTLAGIIAGRLLEI